MKVASFVAGWFAWATLSLAAGLPSSLDTEGNIWRSEGKAVAVVVLGTECPIARKSVATLNEMLGDLQANGIELVGVISEPATTREKVATFSKEYGAKFPLILDTSGDWAALLQPRRTPEAFVLTTKGEIAYRGRIDDSYAAVGKPKAVVTKREMYDAALAVAGGKEVAVKETDAVGCVFESWKSGSENRKVTYHRDVAPIMAVNCVSCHKPGEVAPFSLQNYEDVRKRAEMIAEVTASRFMPPWNAAPQDHKFLDERRLTDREIATLKAWVEAGVPEGDKADAIPVAKTGESEWRLGKPDLVVEMPEAFEVPANGRDVYRAFVVPIDLPDDVYVVATEFKPGAPSVVHHALFYLDGNGAGRQKAAASNDGKPGYVSFGGPGFLPSGGLGGWAPGSSPGYLPEGVGRPIKKGWELIMQLHYHPDGIARQDKSKMALYFAKKPVEKIAVTFPLANRQIDIPAGEAAYEREMNLTLPRGVELIGLMPHMHMLGKSMKVTAILPSGESVQLIDVPQWDFRWQDQYRYADTLKLPAGTKVQAKAVFDNSADNPANPSNPPKRVRWGEQTTDEMCMVFFTLIVDKDSPFAHGLGGGLRRGALLDRLRDRRGQENER